MVTFPVPGDEEDNELEDDLRGGLEEGLETLEHVGLAERGLEPVGAVGAVGAPGHQMPENQDSDSSQD